MDNKSGISGYVFAGGKSSRMGFNKAFLPIHNKPLLQHMIELVDPFCEQVAISGQDSAYEVFNLELVPDVYPDCGPISGLFSVLQHSSTDWNLIVGVDVPFLDAELISYLISFQNQYDCIIPVHHSGIEPLVGLYHRRIRPVIATQINQRIFKLTKLLNEINTLYVDCNHLVEKNPKLFCNINRMEDYSDV